MVYIILGKGFEEVEAVAPMDILRRGGVDAAFAGIGGKTVSGTHSIQITADTTVEKIDLAKTDMLIIPGGMGGVESIEGSKAAMELVKKAYEKGIPLGAICAGPRVLGRVGALKGKHAVCYPGMDSQMGGALIDNSRMACTDGNIVTGRGPGAAISFGLEVLKFLRGEKAAEQVAEGMTYDIR